MRIRNLDLRVLVILALVTGALSAQGGSALGWESGTFGLNGLSEAPTALATYDDGSGPALYVGLKDPPYPGPSGWPGSSWDPRGFAATTELRGIGRWDGQGWSAVGGGVDYGVTALAVFDDGSGPALYAGGDFSLAGTAVSPGIARWNGAMWSAVGVNGFIDVLAVYDDGSGPALFAGGTFYNDGGVFWSSLARWDGSSWSFPIVDGIVRALEVCDHGAGPVLYVGGEGLSAGGASGAVLAWNGSSWSSLATGVSHTSCGFPWSCTVRVSSLEVFDDGFGPALYVGGWFDTAGGFLTDNIARWDGTAWAPLGSGVTLVPHAAICNWTIGCPEPEVRSLAVFDDGTGPALYAGGIINQAGGGAAASGIARWDGSSWSSPGPGVGYLAPAGEASFVSAVPSVDALVGADFGAGPELVAGGRFNVAGTGSANRIARWNGSSWRALHGGVGFPATSIASFDTWGGPALYAAGLFSTPDGSPVNGVGRWQGGTWTAIGDVWGFVEAFEVFDDGTGPALHVGGALSGAGGIATPNIARWDGVTWSSLGTGIDGAVHVLRSFDDGGGPVLHAGGSFDRAGGATASNIARWNGTCWSPLGLGVDGPVHALEVHDDGSGPALYVGGAFTTAGGVGASLVSRWDGSAWSSLGAGFSGTVRALLSFDDGSGPALYAGGSIEGSYSGAFVARWDGSSWTSLGMPPLYHVVALAIHDDGHGPRLVAAGGGSPGAPAVATWDPVMGWAPLLGDLNGTVSALVVADTGDGVRLHVAGDFWTADGVISVGLARSAAVGPRVVLSQGPSNWGSVDLWVQNDRLVPGNEYYNLFSLEPCPAGPGHGPWFGLAVADPNTLLGQLALPIGVAPFHFLASGATESWGPFPGVPVGLTIEAVGIEVIEGGVGFVSPVTRFTTFTTFDPWGGGCCQPQ